MSSFWDRIKPSEPPPPAVIDLNVSKDGQVIRLMWEDGRKTSLLARTLRQNCPCAACVDEWTNKRTLKAEDVPADVVLHKTQPVGNYALSLIFSDQHTTGIYTWPLLRELSDTFPSPV